MSNLSNLNNPNFSIIVGRQHSGTRIIPEAMHRSGVFCGEPLNIAYDLLPPQPLYEACRIFGGYVEYKGKQTWDFSRAILAEIPGSFLDLLELYLQTFINSNSKKKAWKIPENTLIYPWLVRIFPKANFIFWVRHPEGSCSKMTGVDRLEKWNIPCRKYLIHSWNYKMRVVSWKYHFDIVNLTPQPENFINVRYEDYINDPNSIREKIKKLTGVELGETYVNKEKLQQGRKRLSKRYPFLKDAMSKLEYV